MIAAGDAPLNRLIDEFRRLMALRSAITQVGRTRGERWRHEMVQLRRQLTAQIGAVSAALTACPAWPDGAEALQTFRKALSSLRGALAEHQARWPVVSLDLDAPEYRRSATTLKHAYEELERARTLLGRAGRPGG